MLKSINIKNVATYNSKGVEFDNLKKINFVYGLNGTGKTTISNFLQNPNQSEFASCSAVWKEKPLQTLVYNKEFRKQNFGKGKLNGIFTLGKATKEQLQEIESKKEILHKIIQEGKDKRTTLIKLEERKEQTEIDFREKCWTKQRKYKNVFKEAFRGASNKENFKNRVVKEFYSTNSTLLPLEDLEDKAKIVFNVYADVLPSIKLNLMLINSFNDIENNPIWKKIIIGKSDVDIANLIQELNMNDWINQGKKYLQENETCPFCQQQTITDNFKNQLENYFDENYLKDIETLQNLKKEYTILTKQLIDQLDEIENTQKKNKDSKLNKNRFSIYLKTLVSQNAHNNELLNIKLKEPSRSIELISLHEQFGLIEDLIDEANKETKTHNNLIANYSKERNSLTNSVWKFIIEELRSDYERYLKKTNEISNQSKILHQQRNEQLKEYENINNQLVKLSQDTTGIQTTINEMNELLKKYNFLDIEIVATNENGFYQIKRQNGELAEATLSEGETTFLTFIYFLQLTKGGNSEQAANKERIVIIDDPISNLDNKAVSVISFLIKEMIIDLLESEGNIKQIILLTHNSIFSKELSSSKELKEEKENTCFWILKKNNNVTELQNFSKR